MTTAFCPSCQKIQPMRVQRWRQRAPIGYPTQQSKGKMVTIERITCTACHLWLKDSVTDKEISGEG